ncbi:hypothetical protein [Pseudomonas aeruginosa]|uniref:hypothetical protein n=1 Tax=Pseudomonas aeruginosa TaxID=287 RepID=UPI000FFE3760|nr:hypothetical protein [Pseudomonas aeruginosa]
MIEARLRLLPDKEKPQVRQHLGLRGNVIKLECDHVSKHTAGLGHRQPLGGKITRYYCVARLDRDLRAHGEQGPFETIEEAELAIKFLQRQMPGIPLEIAEGFWRGILGGFRWDRRYAEIGAWTGGAA